MVLVIEKDLLKKRMVTHQKSQGLVDMPCKVRMYNSTDLCRVEGGDDVEIMDEKSTEEKSAEELKKTMKEKSDDGIVCIE